MGRKHDRNSKEHGFNGSANRARKEIGISVLEPIKRKCLKCSEEFQAVLRSSNFMCEKCRRFKDDGSFDA